MKYLLKNGTKCLIVQSKFSSYSFWNYVDVCKMVGAKYPAPPLGLLTVAALLPQQWTFRLIDANIEPVLDEHFEWADIVCIGGMLPQQSSMLALIDRAHRFDCPVVVGGPDPTSQPELYQSADYRVLGEGEVTIPMFIADLKKGCPSGQYQSADKADMTQAVVPRFDLIRFQDYLQVSIQYSRGCPFQCEFCNIVELFGRIPRTKKPEQVLRELQTLYDLGHRGHIDIVDDNFIGHKTNVRTLLTAVRKWSAEHKYPFYFSTECSINLAEDDTMMQMMKDLDFRYVFIGIETPENDALIMTEKSANINIPVGPAIKKIYQYGMIVNAGFIIGLDYESDQIAENMIHVIQDSGISMAMLGLLYALPDTRLSRRLIKEGRLFEASSCIEDDQRMIDQTSSGLNFITNRPRIDILRDFLRVESVIYNSENYFKRVTDTALLLQWTPKHRPHIKKAMKTGLAFLTLSRQLLRNRSTAWPYLKMILTVIFNNPGSLEPAANLAAMFIHFQKQSQFIMKNIHQDMTVIERFGYREPEITVRAENAPEEELIEECLERE